MCEIRITFGGLCRPDPGGIGVWGYTVQSDGQLVRRAAGTAGEGQQMSIHVADFTALLEALKWLASSGMEGDVTLSGSSTLVLFQVTRKWKVRSSVSRQFVPQIQGLLTGRKIYAKWVPRGVNPTFTSLCEAEYRNRLKSHKGAIDLGREVASSASKVGNL
jgi:ribonuclease HI